MSSANWLPEEYSNFVEAVGKTCRAALFFIARQCRPATASRLTGNLLIAWTDTDWLDTIAARQRGIGNRQVGRKYHLWQSAVRRLLPAYPAWFINLRVTQPRLASSMSSRLARLLAQQNVCRGAQSQYQYQCYYHVLLYNFITEKGILMSYIYAKVDALDGSDMVGSHYCVALVQHYAKVPHTPAWRAGKMVKGNPLIQRGGAGRGGAGRGTAIATRKSQKSQNDILNF